MNKIRIMAISAMILIALSSGVTWAGSDRGTAKTSQSIDINITPIDCQISWTQTVYNWALKHSGYASLSPDNQDAQVVPESNTIIGFGAALVLNGLGAVGTSYYLRRKYNRESAKRYAGRHVNRLPLMVDTTISVLVLISVSPVLLTVATVSALKSGNPKVYSRTQHV